MLYVGQIRFWKYSKIRTNTYNLDNVKQYCVKVPDYWKIPNCIFICPMIGQCMSKCPMDWQSISNCRMSGQCIFNCPMAGQCVSNCPMDGQWMSNCLIICQFIFNCLMVWQRISNCPKVGQCMSSCPIILQCMFNCPMIGQVISSWLLVGQCMFNCLMVVECMSNCSMIALHCVNRHCILKLMSQNVTKFYTLSKQEVYFKIRAFCRPIFVRPSHAIGQFQTILTPGHMSRVTFFFFFFFRTKWWSLSVEGLLSTGPTPSSSYIKRKK